MSRRTRGSLLSSCALALFLVLGSCSLTGAAPRAALETVAGGLSAHLTKTSFAAPEADSVRLVYSFVKESTSFSYRLALKQGEKWRLVRSVKTAGRFKGSHTMSVKRLFGSKQVKVGSYRLLVAGDSGKVLLRFTVILAEVAGPSSVAGITSATQVSAGGGHTCVLLSSGKVKCWGWNFWGQLGNGNVTSSVAPVSVGPLGPVVQISAGFAHTCAVVSGGTVFCWGGALRNLTDTTQDADTVPFQVAGISTAVQVSASTGEFSCALLADGIVECWGWNLEGELGNGATTTSLGPTPVSGIRGAAQIATGYEHGCALLPGGSVECWGSNHFGQLGNGTTTLSLTPVAVGGLSGAVQISAGLQHTCALLSSGKVVCWGGNQWGQLGNGTKNDSSTPVEARGIAKAVQISVGSDHSCALLSDHTIRCWGNNITGQLGGGWEKIDSPLPLAVRGVTNAVQISAGSPGYFGSTHTCAVLSDGKVKCWGYNGYGQVGLPASGA